MQYIDREDIEEIVTEKPLVLIKASAEWCGPCRMFNPVLDQFAEDYSVPVYTIDIEDNPEWADENTIKSIPATLVFRNGAVVDTLIGARPYAKLIKDLEEWL